MKKKETLFFGVLYSHTYLSGTGDDVLGLSPLVTKGINAFTPWGVGVPLLSLPVALPIAVT